MKIRVHLLCIEADKSVQDSVTLEVRAKTFRNPDLVKCMAINKIIRTGFPARPERIWHLEGYEIID